MRKLFTNFLMTFLLFAGTVSAQTIRYVKPVASGTGDGLSWDNASGNLQAMIDELSSLPQGTTKEVRLGTGTHIPQVIQGTTATEFYKSFLLRDNVNIVGGYTSATNKTTTKSVLSGNLGNGNYVYNVVIATGLTSGVTLDNISIEDGSASAGGARTGITGTPFTVKGAAIVIVSSNLNLIDVDIKNNTSRDDGGAINVTSTASATSTITMTRGEVSGNSFTASGKAGGGIFLPANTTFSATETTFKNNSTGSGNSNGGAIFSNSATVTLNNCTFTNNTATGYGGALQLLGTSVITIDKCIFTNNTASGNVVGTTVLGGGALNIHNENIQASVTNSKFYGNSAPDGAGGAIRYLKLVKLENNIFYSNSAKMGGAISMDRGTATFSNNTFYSNSAKTDGAVFYKFEGSTNPATLSLYNSIFIDNKVGDPTPTTEKNFEGTNLTVNVKNSIFSGAQTAMTGTTDASVLFNTSPNVVFASITPNDPNFLRLKGDDTNPAIDGGDNSAATLANDISGITLRKIAKKSATATVDMGAYEFDGVLPVNLLYFSAKPSRTTSALSWATATETNNKYFVLARSGNGIDFTFLANVTSKGNTGAVYTHTDYTPLNGENYYKLSQVDGDGTIKELGVQIVKHNLTNNQATAYPNPMVNGKTTIVFEQNTFNTLVVYNANGAVVYVAAITKNEVSKALNLNHLSTGMYVIQLKGLGTSQSIKLAR